MKAISKKNEYEDEGFEKESKDLNDSIEAERQITKVYELNLPCGVVSNKKINYVNKGKEICEFELTSNDPENMIVKEKTVKILPGDIGKFQLRFSTVSFPDTKEYLLNVENCGQAWESFKFVVKYE